MNEDQGANRAQHELDDLLGFANLLADAAGSAVLPYFRAHPPIDDKPSSGGFDPVTEADRKAERIMRDMILARYPTDGIIGEELGEVASESGRTWILDPIDGTKSFILGVPLWGILIGLEIDGLPVLGLMDQPFTRERYVGANQAAWMIDASGERKLETGGRQSLEQAFLATTDPDLFSAGAELGAFQRLQGLVRLTRFGGDCYFYCQLAAGHIDLVVEAGLKPHDIVPLIPIVEGAGGIVTDWRGKPAKGGQVIAAANKALHASALKALRE